MIEGFQKLGKKTLELEGIIAEIWRQICEF